MFRRETDFLTGISVDIFKENSNNNYTAKAKAKAELKIGSISIWLNVIDLVPFAQFKKYEKNPWRSYF